MKPDVVNSARLAPVITSASAPRPHACTILLDIFIKRLLQLQSFQRKFQRTCFLLGVRRGAPLLEIAGSNPAPAVRFQRNKTNSSSLTSKDSILWGAYREVACSASDRQESNLESCDWGGGGEQCHLIHLTILRRFSWPGLACMCTKMAYTPIQCFFANRCMFVARRVCTH